MLKHEPHRLFEVFLLLNLELLSLVKMLPIRLHTRLISIVHSRIVPHRHLYWHFLLRIESEILGGLPHHNPFIAQFMSGLLILQVRVVPRYSIPK